MPCSPIQQLGRAGHTQRNKNKQIKSKTSDSNSLSKEGQMVGWNRQIRQNLKVFCRVLVLVCQFWFSSFGLRDHQPSEFSICSEVRTDLCSHLNNKDL